MFDSEPAKQDARPTEDRASVLLNRHPCVILLCRGAVAVRRQQPVLRYRFEPGTERGVGSSIELKLGQDVVHVGFDRRDTDTEMASNRFVR